MDVIFRFLILAVVAVAVFVATGFFCMATIPGVIRDAWDFLDKNANSETLKADKEQFIKEKTKYYTIITSVFLIIIALNLLINAMCD